MIRKPPDWDELIDRLTTKYRHARDIEFTPATDGVVSGFELEASGNRSYGKNVFVSSGSRFEADAEDRSTGVMIRVGTTESYERGELRCLRSGDQIAVAVYGPDGARISRKLTCAAGDAKAYDEGAFTWFGPVEAICTPWSDNDPSQCQVITVDRLRIFAADRKTDKD